MTTHRAVVEAGPGRIRRLCCGTDIVDDDTRETFSAALDAIDDAVALVRERPVAVGSLWRATLRSLECGRSDGMLVLHPSWWPAARVEVVRAAGDGIVPRPRSWLLRQASPDASVVVEIAEEMVVVSGAAVVAVPRRAGGFGAEETADEVAGAITRMTPAGAVLIDAPGAVKGAPALMAAVAGALRGGGRTVLEIDEARLARLARLARAVQPAREQAPEPVGPLAPEPRRRARTLAGLTVASAVLAIPVVAPWGRHSPPTYQISAQIAPTTFLVEGRVALTVPANWPTQRVLAGPGSARLQITSPSDPEMALHVTQTPVAGETLEWYRGAFETGYRRGAGRGVRRLQPGGFQRRPAGGDLPRSARSTSGAVVGAARRRGADQRRVPEQARRRRRRARGVRAGRADGTRRRLR